jgi:hypothetical protein
MRDPVSFQSTRLFVRERAANLFVAVSDRTRVASTPLTRKRAFLFRPKELFYAIRYNRPIHRVRSCRPVSRPRRGRHRTCAVHHREFGGNRVRSVRGGGRRRQSLRPKSGNGLAKKHPDGSPRHILVHCPADGKVSDRCRKAGIRQVCPERHYPGARPDGYRSGYPGEVDGNVSGAGPRGVNFQMDGAGH